jgi:hypothetical protein
MMTRRAAASTMWRNASWVAQAGLPVPHPGVVCCDDDGGNNVCDDDAASRRVYYVAEGVVGSTGGIGCATPGSGRCDDDGGSGCCDDDGGNNCCDDDAGMIVVMMTRRAAASTMGRKTSWAAQAGLPHWGAAVPDC